MITVPQKRLGYLGQMGVLTLIVLLSFVLFLTAFYLGAEAEHDCREREHCPVCVCIELCGGIVRHSTAAHLAPAYTAAVFPLIRTAGLLSFGLSDTDNPVAKRVRLNI